MLELLGLFKIIPEIEKFFVILINLILISIAISSISLTIATSNFFQPFRNLFNITQDDKIVTSISETLTKFGKVKMFFGDLFSCHYCISHWVSLVFVHFYHPSIFENRIFNFIVLIFIVKFNVPS